MRNALEHEEPQRPSEMAVQEGEGGAEGLRAVVGREERKQVCERACVMGLITHTQRSSRKLPAGLRGKTHKT